MEEICVFIQYVQLNRFSKFSNKIAVKSESSEDIRELKQTTTTTSKKTSPNKRLNEQNNSCARAL